jgi:type I restriction enzyme M protein
MQGKIAGEFYTPHEVSVLMSEIIAEHLKDKEHIKSMIQHLAQDLS